MLPAGGAVSGWVGPGSFFFFLPPGGGGCWASERLRAKFGTSSALTLVQISLTRTISIAMATTMVTGSRRSWGTREPRRG